MGPPLEKRLHKLWGVIKPSSDVRGQGVGHCLELDVITTGNSLDHCREMLREASAMVIVDDLDMGLNPYDRADRDDPVWSEWHRIMQDGELRLTTSGAPNPEAYIWAVRWSVQVEAVTVDPAAETTEADLLCAAAGTMPKRLGELEKLLNPSFGGTSHASHSHVTFERS